MANRVSDASNNGLSHSASRIFCLFSIIFPMTVHADSPPIRIHFLGTGGPEITRDRMGPSTLIQAAGENFLFDTGRGVLKRLGESRLKISAVEKVFFTHLHSDHIEGLSALWVSSWFITKRNEPMQFWGPPGTQKMLQGTVEFMHHDVKAGVNFAVRARGVEIKVTGTTEDVVYQSNGVKISTMTAERGDGLQLRGCTSFLSKVSRNLRKTRNFNCRL